MNIKRIFLTGILLAIVRILFAQADFRPGYVITNDNDTLRGEIDYRGDILMKQQCRFRSDRRNVVEYRPTDIAAYRFTDSKYFVSKVVDGKMVFLEFLVKGRVEVYYMRGSSSQLRYFIGKEDEPLTELPYESTFREIDGKCIAYETKFHQGILNYYMQDAPSIKDEIVTIKKPGHDNLIKVAEDYHAIVCKDGDPCIVFEKKLPPLKVAWDIVIGFVSYSEYSTTSFQGGMLLNLWMPRANEKLYFRTGVLISKANIDEDDIYSYAESQKMVYKIPLMFEYIYPKSTIRPKLAYGLSLYSSNETFAGSVVSMMGGFNIQLSKSASLILEYDVDFFSSRFPLIPQELMAQAFLCGLSLRF